MNPGGSVKDRVALSIIQDALASGSLQEAGLITEGTAGSTGTQSSSIDDSVVLKGSDTHVAPLAAQACKLDPVTRFITEVRCTKCRS